MPLVADQSNATDFDLSNAPPAEEAEMVSGCLDEIDKAAISPITGPAYDDGRRMARDDRAGGAVEDRQELARR